MSDVNEGGVVQPPLPTASAEEAARAAIARDEAQPSTDAIQTIQHRTWTRAIWSIVGVCVLLVALGWGAGSIANSFALSDVAKADQSIQEQPDGQSVATPDGARPHAILRWSESLGIATLHVSGLEKAGEDQEYALWYRDGTSYVRAVAFDVVNGDAEVLITSLWSEGEHLEISLEPEGGTSSGLPLGDALVLLPTVAP